MSRSYGRRGVLGVLVVVATLCLLLAAGPASAATVNHVQGAVTGVLDNGESEVLSDGTVHTTGWVASAVFYRATGPDGWRFLGNGVVCLEVWEPAKGDNLHRGDVVWMTFAKDPAAPGAWDADQSFAWNLANFDLTWTGWWDGLTHNKHNHQATLSDLVGAGETNEGCTAAGNVMSMQFGVANWRSGIYVGTPFNVVVAVSAP